jgi:hypothetical protein
LEIIECLGQKARSDPNDAFVAVIIAAATYRQFAESYKRAGTRKFLRLRLEKLRDAVAAASKILRSGDPFFFAALSLGGMAQEKAGVLPFSEALVELWKLEHAANSVLVAPWLTGPALGQNLWAEGPKTALVIDCARIFERYRPGEVTRTERKSPGFSAFVRIVYEVATGEAHATLDRAIRDALALIRDDSNVKASSNPLVPFDPLELLRRHLRKL